MKSQFFSIGKELYESILKYEPVIPLFSLKRYLILSESFSQ